MLQALSGLNPCFPNEIKYKVLNVMDVPWENLIKHFTDTNRFIKNALSCGGVVFVHCYGGVSRSATLVIAYLMQQYQMSMFEAMSYVKSKRSVIFPNPGF